MYKHRKLKDFSHTSRAAAKVICSYEDRGDGYRLDHSKIPEVLKDHDFTYILQFGFLPEPEQKERNYRHHTLEELKQ